MRLLKWWVDARDSLWAVPLVFVLASAVLAFVMIAVDRATPDLATAYPLVFGGGAEGARGLLSSIAGSMISVAGITFSITLVALQLASSQYSPRVLRTFTADRVSQIVLGTFLGAFTYSILVLRSIRGEEGVGDQFVPALSIGLAIAIAVAAIVLLVYFIHHIATRIQAATIVENIADETTRLVAEWPESAADDVDARPPPEPPGVLLATDTGHLQLVDTDELVRIARELLCVLRLEVVPGDWVQRDAPLFSVWPAEAANPRLGGRVAECVTLGAQRSMEQDVAFGLRQLVDVAVKALSPGINDPTTAIDCMHRIGRILVAAGHRHHPPSAFLDDGGELRLVVPRRSWDDLVDLAFDQLRQYSAGNADVSVAMARTLHTMALALPAVRLAAIRRHARRIGETAAAISPAADRRSVEEAVDRVLAARPIAPGHDEAGAGGGG